MKFYFFKQKNLERIQEIISRVPNNASLKYKTQICIRNSILLLNYFNHFYIFFLSCTCDELFSTLYSFNALSHLVLGEDVRKNNLIMNNPDLILRKNILTKNDAITQHK
jgi:hypothetical protein